MPVLVSDLTLLSCSFQYPLLSVFNILTIRHWISHLLAYGIKIQILLGTFLKLLKNTWFGIDDTRI